MSAEVIKKAFQATEEGFLSIVTNQFPTRPQIATVGSCCLVCVICDGTLYVANAGDSRAVLGQVMRATGEAHATQLSTEHNASIESVRRELQALHPDHPDIVVLKHNVWRVKGIIQVETCSWTKYVCTCLRTILVFLYCLIGFKIHWRCVSETVRVQPRTAICEIPPKSTVQQAVTECRAIDNSAYAAAA